MALMREKYLEPIHHNKHSISNGEKVAKFEILGKVFKKTCTF